MHFRALTNRSSGSIEDKSDGLLSRINSIDRQTDEIIAGLNALKNKENPEKSFYDELTELVRRTIGLGSSPSRAERHLKKAVCACVADGAIKTPFVLNDDTRDVLFSHIDTEISRAYGKRLGLPVLPASTSLSLTR